LAISLAKESLPTMAIFRTGMEAAEKPSLVDISDGVIIGLQ
jgi:hypothetical protein